MVKKKLKNGLSVIAEKKKSKSVVIELQVVVGSNNEDNSNRGISHFIEHMLFEGTKNRTSHEISNEIESIGGELNAFTSHDRTVYYAVVPRRHFSTGLNVISDIILNPLFDEKAIEKERRVINDEINLINDDPKFYQFVFFLKNLYKKHNIKHPISGYKETISRIKRDDIISFYKKHYVPSNMTLAIVGNIGNDLGDVEKKFSDPIMSKSKKEPFFKEPMEKKESTFVEERKINQSYLVFGCKAPFRNSKESYAIDVIRSALARGQSSKLFNELRTKRGLCYALGGHYDAGLDYGYLAIYVGTDKKNIGKVVSIIKSEIRSLEHISKRELLEAKRFIIGNFEIEAEDQKKLADEIAFWEMVDEKTGIKNYLREIKGVNEKDVARAAKKYFKNYTLSIIRQA